MLLRYTIHNNQNIGVMMAYTLTNPEAALLESLKNQVENRTGRTNISNSKELWYLLSSTDGLLKRHILASINASIRKCKEKMNASNITNQKRISLKEKLEGLLSLKEKVESQPTAKPKPIALKEKQLIKLASLEKKVELRIIERKKLLNITEKLLNKLLKLAKKIHMQIENDPLNKVYANNALAQVQKLIKQPEGVIQNLKQEDLKDTRRLEQFRQARTQLENGKEADLSSYELENATAEQKFADIKTEMQNIENEYLNTVTKDATVELSEQESQLNKGDEEQYLRTRVPDQMTSIKNTERQVDFIEQNTNTPQHQETPQPEPQKSSDEILQSQQPQQGTYPNTNETNEPPLYKAKPAPTKVKGNIVNEQKASASTPTPQYNGGTRKNKKTDETAERQKTIENRFNTEQKKSTYYIESPIKGGEKGSAKLQNWISLHLQKNEVQQQKTQRQQTAMRPGGT